MIFSSKVKEDTAVLELKNVSAGYGKTEILHDLSIGFGKNRLTSIIGPNGCGKSTLLKAALGMLPHTQGEISIDHVSLSALNRKAIAKQVAYLAQGRDTPDMTVEQMVLHGRFPHISYPRQYASRDREIAASAMDQAGVLEFAHKPVCALSGGMRQSAYIAMALAQETDYILLDEPTTYLDISHQLDVLRLLRSLADDGRGIVAVMHDLPLAFRFSDRVAVMDKGRIFAHGTPEEICVSGLVEQIFGVQIRREGEEYFYKY